MYLFEEDLDASSYAQLWNLLLRLNKAESTRAIATRPEHLAVDLKMVAGANGRDSRGTRSALVTCAF